MEKSPKKKSFYSKQTFFTPSYLYSPADMNQTGDPDTGRGKKIIMFFLLFSPSPFFIFFTLSAKPGTTYRYSNNYPLM
jgi:hypothetical protein